MSVHREMILNLLHNLGSRREVSRYIDEFGGERDAPPVVIKVGGAILAERLVELACAIACLGHVGVRPVVVHGAGPQISAAIDAAGVAPAFIDGNRVTSPETLEVVLREFARVSTELAREIQHHGIPSRAIRDGVFTARRTSDERLGLVGDVRGVEVARLRDAREAGIIPIVSPLALDENRSGLNVNADVAARELAIALRAQKVVFLTATGGLLDERGRLIPAITLADDYDRLLGEDWVHSGMRLKLREINELLERLPGTSSAAITSPEHLASELFTYRGAGTLVRRGFEIVEHRSIETLDRERLADLVSQSFGRRLRPDYFEERSIKRVLVAGDYTAAAVLTGWGGSAYLDKFAVTNEARGQGLAGSLWKRIIATEPALFWRSRAGNEINPWYTARADGMQRAGEWVVFWCGMRDAAEIARAARHALGLEDSFLPRVVVNRESVVGV